MRALTRLHNPLGSVEFPSRNNEVLAREGIDTVDLQNSTISFLSNNEVLAREGIDTYLENM